MKRLSRDVGEVVVPCEESVFEALLDRHRSFIHEVVSRFAPQRLGILQSEIEQETAIRVWRTLRNEREIRDFRSYVYRVAATATFDSIREVSRRQERQLDAQEFTSLTVHPSLPGSRAVSPEDEMCSKALVGQITTLVESLPANRSQAVKLHLQGFTSLEIGEICGWSEPKARNLTYRGLDELRGKIRQAGLDDPVE